MIHARLFELGIVVINLLLIGAAFAFGSQVSVSAGVALLFLVVFTFMSLFFRFDYPIVRRMVKADDLMMLNLCQTGFVGRIRRVFKLLPTSPRCRFCFVPFGGVGKLMGLKPSAKNPNYCRSCFEGIPNGTHEMELGVLFADIRGFTSWTESHGAGDAAGALSRFYDTANRVLTRDDAFVEFVGDQIMALYLVKMPSLGHRTSDVMLAAAKRLLAEVRNQPDALPVGASLNFGTAQVGNLAKGGIKDFTAVGDVINTGARLQGRAGEYEIVLSESVYAAVAEKEPGAKRTTFELKGKAEPLNAYVIDSVN